MEDLKVKAFLDANSGSGNGSGSGYGCGDGSGYGWGYGSGDGWGSGSGSGDGSGYGSGDGSGDGWGYGYGDGSGDGSGDGGIAEINGNKVYEVDGVPTIFGHINGNMAKGSILMDDLTLRPCYIVKGNGLFAHGDSIREAMAALTSKLFEGMSEEERIAEFIKTHPDKSKAYPNRDLFEWHNKLTGSCLAGRNAWIKNHGLSLDGETTVDEFIKLTRNAYGGHVIEQLSNAYHTSLNMPPKGE